MTARLRVGLIGCGDFSRAFGRYIQELADIVAISSLRAEETAATAAALGLDAPQFTDYRRMLEAVRLDAVVITASNDVHAEATIAAAEAGLHVYCEKAMARTVSECWQMVRSCQRHNVKLMVGHKRRLRPPWARMIELTRPDGPLGEPLAITACGYADYRPYRFTESWWSDPSKCGGFFHAANIHVIDWFRAMCGDCTRVSAMPGPQHDSRYGYPDILHATFQFKSGSVASIQGGLLFPIHKFRESEGPWGECRHGGFKFVPHLDHIDLYWQRLDDERQRHERFDDLGFDHAYRLEIVDFVRWVTDDRPPCLTWVEGLRCVEMMEAAHRSAELMGEVITLPLYPDLEEAPKAPCP